MGWAGDEDHQFPIKLVATITMESVPILSHDREDLEASSCTSSMNFHIILLGLVLAVACRSRSVQRAFCFV